MQNETWTPIPDGCVRHIWCDPNDETIEVAVEPSSYAISGTPITEDAGDDMIYVRTEIQKPTNYDDLMRLLLAVCPGGSTGDDNYGQVILYTDMVLKQDDTLEDFNPDA